MWSQGQKFTADNEGCRLEAYQDIKGFWTIGYGHKMDGDCAGSSITQSTADNLFNSDYAVAIARAKSATGIMFEKIGEARQAALIDMAFQLGFTGLCEFRNMLDAIADMDWAGARFECLSSEYARQVPVRASRVAEMLFSGEFPETALASSSA
jgi:lysozyme